MNPPRIRQFRATLTVPEPQRTEGLKQAAAHGN
jgi:hypothetical protein